MDNDEAIIREDATAVEFAIKRSLLSKNKLAIILKGKGGAVQYCCVQCPVKCLDKEKLEAHLLVHYNEYKFLCGICGTGLKRKEHLDRHTLEHQERRPHVCSECGKAFKRKEHLNIHLSVHSGAKTHFCSLCNKKFHRKDHLTKHLHTHNKIFLENNMQPLTDQEMMMLKQEVIDYDENQMTDESAQDMDAEYNEQQEYNDIVNRSQDTSSEYQTDAAIKKDPLRPFACALCSKTYKRKDHLKLHSWTHLKKEKICNICGKAFHRDEQLMMHMNTHFRAGGYLYDEDSPDVSSNHYYSLPKQEVSRESKMSYESRPHECPLCHRRFKRRQHLDAHANVHRKGETSSKIFCSLCIGGFDTNEEFNEHDCMRLKNRIGNSGQESVMIPIQNAYPVKKENKSPLDFVEVDLGPSDGTHFEMIRNEEDIPVPKRVFVCRFCSKTFKRKDHYKIHLNIHTGVKTFFCPECGKGFYRKDHMQKHTQVHFKVKPKMTKIMPKLYPIRMMTSDMDRDIKPEITIHAPAKMRVPLKIKVPYQMVIDTEQGMQSVTVDPQEDDDEIEDL